MIFIKKAKKIIKESKYLLHETKRHVLLRYILAVLIFLFYFWFISLKYGVENGFLITLLTWSFFVFCTPIADAGFLLDFPLRLVLGIRMLYSEILVWIFAFSLNVISLLFFPSIYEKTILLKLLKQILLHPFPYWSIIGICAIGTFLSIYFGDELIDVSLHKERIKYHSHKNKHRLIILIFFLLIVVLLYSNILRELGIEINI